MIPPDSRIAPGSGVEDGGDAGFLRLATVILRRWKLILLVTAATTVLTAALVFSLPRTWTSRVVLVPSSSGSGDSRLQMLASAIPGLAGRLGSAGGGGAGSTVVSAIVDSEAVRDSVGNAARQNGHTTLDERELRKLLKKAATVDIDPVDRSIAIEITTRDRELSRNLAAAYPDAVNSIATSIAIEAASHKRATLERQIEVAQENLQRTQEVLLEYQVRTGTPQIQEQARQTVIAAAELQRTVTQAELRVAELARVTTPDNPEYRAAVAQLSNLRGQLRRLATEGSDVLLSRSDLPAVQIELARRLRDYAKDEQAYTGLSAALLDAQLDLTERLEVVSVLDAANLPDKPSGPRRALMLVLAVMTGGMAGLFLAYTSEYMAAVRRARPDEPFFVEWDRMRQGRGGARAGNGRSVKPG
jgi:tyrosine-protein kinase Etk/Wzc